MSNLVSIVMSVFNEEKSILQDSINSILNQTYKNFEFLIVLDNPTNNEILEILNDYSIKDKRVKIIINNKNIGLANSLNKAIYISQGEFIARMDGDDIAVPERIELQIEYLNKHPEIDLLSSNVIYIDEKNSTIGQSNTKNLSPKKIKRLMKYSNILNHPTWMFRKEAFNLVSGYRPFPNSQDYDFALRLLDANRKIMILNSELLYYRVHEKSISTSSSWKQFMLFKYIKLNHKYRKNKKKDIFSEKELIKIINDSKNGNEQYEKGLVLLRNGVAEKKYSLIFKSMFYTKDNFTQAKDFLISSILKRF